MRHGVLNAARDSVRSRLWPLPVLAVTLAFVLGVVIPRADRAVDASMPPWLRSILFSGDPGAARTVLDAVSSSLITVTSLTFSLTVVTLQLASSQFSPRLLRTFTSDVFVQATLGLFLATFTFSLTVLRSVRSQGDSQSVFVPRMAVTVSFALAMASVFGLVVFLAHLARQIRVETMLRDVHADASATISAVAEDGSHRRPAPSLARPDFATTILAPTSGFLIGVDEDDLLRIAEDADVHVVLDRYPGASLVAGTPIGSCWSSTRSNSGDDSTQLQELVGSTLQIGYERTAAQDIGYGLRQLTDVANKALSPGVNDPTTAVHALGHIAAVLCELAGRDLGPKVLRGENGSVRVMLIRPGFAELVDASISQPRRFGSSDAQVMARMFALLDELAWHVTGDDRSVVVSHLDRMKATVATSDFDDTEVVQLEAAAVRVADTLAVRRRTENESN